MQVQYRNCNYIGNFQDYQREGFGMLLFDNSNILIAKWKANVIDGPFAFLSDKINAFGTMVAGKLSGYNVISIKETKIKTATILKGTVQHEQQRAMFCMFRDNRPYGKFVLINKGEATMGQYIQGQVGQLSEERARYESQILQLLNRNFQNRPYQIQQYLTQLINEAEKQFQSMENTKFLPSVIEYDNNTAFYGFVDLTRKNKKLGFIMDHKGQILTVGEHDEIYLEGLGRAYKNGVIEDGVFKGGILHGIGIRYFSGPHRYELGQYQRGEGIEKGFGFPSKQIADIRKQFHLRAIQFYNDIVVLSIETLFQAVIENAILQISHKQSPRFSGAKNPSNQYRKSTFGEKSPMKSRLDKYQSESDYIGDTSPIKEPLNSYSRVQFANEARNSRASKYPSQYDERQRRDNSRSNRASNERKHRDDDERSTRSGKKIKDTKTLVKQLDEREKHKRSYLDQIYKDAKLYRKN